MFLLIISLWLRTSLSFGLEMSESWTHDNRPQLNISCEKTERFCVDLCNQEMKCQLEMRVCKDCIGTSLLMTNIFENMGIHYRNDGVAVSSYEMIDFLKEKSFVLFSSRSIYNQLDSYDSPPIRARFQKLCPGEVEYPVVFFSLKKGTSLIDKVKYVACGADMFSMSAGPDITYNKLRFHYLNFPLN